MYFRTILLAAAFSASLAACTSQPAPPVAVQASPRSIEYPWMSMERWYRMHAEDVGVASQGSVDLLFIGDSITEGWPEQLMEHYFGRYNPANFGIGGDQTGNVLWRLRNGSVGQLQPKVVSLLIGVNNFGLRGDSPEDVIQGITAVVEELHSVFPESNIVLHGVFPYKQFASSPERANIEQVNTQIAKLAENENVYFLNVGPQLLEPNGDISPEVMPDFLHLSQRGYRIWADALMPLISQLLNE